jgi:hypothetical protein
MTRRQIDKTAREARVDRVMARIAAERADAWARNPGTKYDCSDLRKAAEQWIRKANYVR